MAMTEPINRVLLVLESIFPLPVGGGAESQVRTLALEFLRRGQAVEVVVPMVAGGPTLAQDNSEGIPITRIRYPKVPWIGAAWMLLSLAALLVRRRQGYSLIHAHIAGNMAAVASLVGWLLGKPVVVKLTGMTEMRGGIIDASPRLGGRVRKLAMRRANAYQATSQRIGDLLVSSGFAPQKVLQLPNAVDVQRFSSPVRDEARRAELCGGRRLVGIFVGRLEPEKGLEGLLEAWSQVFGRDRSAVLLVVGRGSVRPLLEQRTRSLGIEDLVVFTGPTRAVEQYMALADFGLLTSLYEGLSNSLLEYMAAGLPVLGSKISGTEDWVIDGQTGWLYAAGQTRDLVARLTAVARSDAAELRRLGDGARDRVTRYASIPAVVTALQQAYERLDRQHG